MSRLAVRGVAFDVEQLTFMLFTACKSIVRVNQLINRWIVLVTVGTHPVSHSAGPEYSYPPPTTYSVSRSYKGKDRA